MQALDHLRTAEMTRLLTFAILLSGAGSPPSLPARQPAEPTNAP